MKRIVELLRSHGAALLVLAAGSAAYSNSFAAPFVFDDVTFIAENPAVYQLWPPTGWLTFNPARVPAFFSFALNYALHGEEVFGYHVINLAIHLATALTLLGLIRRTLGLPCIAERYRRVAGPFAASAALVWVVHPLCTQAVTYVYQRIESLTALFIVGSLYAFVRAYGGAKPAHGGWAVASLAATYLALMSKESAVALPLLTLLYDGLFFGRSWSNVLARRRYHLAAFASWGILAALIVVAADDYQQAGIAVVDGLTPISYALSQAGVILHYLRLSVAPFDLCLDYHWPIARHWHQIVPQTIVVLALLFATARGVYRRRLWSFPAAAFFLLLGPTSSIIPIVDLIFEHRMYLPLACVLTLLAAACFEVLNRLESRITAEAGRRRLLHVATVLFTALVVALIGGTLLRNRDYADGTTIWLNVIAKVPDNARAHFNAGCFYRRHGDDAEFRRRLSESLRLDPNFSPALFRQTELDLDEGRLDEADACLARIKPKRQEEAKLLLLTSRLRAAQGRRDEAIEACLAAHLRSPHSVTVMITLSSMLADAGRWGEAAPILTEAVRIAPDEFIIHNLLGRCHAADGRPAAAVAEFREALRLAPNSAAVRSNLGVMLDRIGQGTEALVELQRAVVDDPAFVVGYVNLGTALARRGRLAEATQSLERAVELDPQNATARENLRQAKLDLQATSSRSNASLARP